FAARATSAAEGATLAGGGAAGGQANSARPASTEDQAIATNAPHHTGARQSPPSPSSTAGTGATRRRTGVGRLGSRLHDEEGHARRSGQLRPLLPPALRSR